MKNWKTTLAGCIGAAVLVVLNLYQTGTVDWRTLVMAAAIAAVGVLAKDLNVTGV